jgi:CRISPR-associated protein Cmr2
VSRHLLSIGIGPVQDFISAARRTRDLWFGSYLLSEISRAAAKSLLEGGAELVFPPGQTVAELDSASLESVSNKLLAVVPAGLEPRALALRARDAAREHWRIFADDVRGQLSRAIREDLWDLQVDDVIECFAAWVPLDVDYRKARADVERLLAGRKALRDFGPAEAHDRGWGIPKSSLDGARESVISDPAKLPASVRMRARLKDNEHLDAIGFVKRLGGEEDRLNFTSVSRIAVDPWVRGVCTTEQGCRLLAEFAADCGKLGTLARERDPVYKKFPYDGEILMESRYPDLRRELADRESGGQAGLGTLEAIRSRLKDRLYREFGRPEPYLAVLVADGDRIGAALSRLGSIDEHRRFSRCVSAFSSQAGRIIRDHHGSLVFSGGDDVLAFLPVDTCLEAARSLRDSFASYMESATGNEPPTFSVGIAIGHCLEPLEDLLARGRRAEQQAKRGGRNALAVTWEPRAGSDISSVVDQWPNKPDHRLKRWADLHIQGSISDRAAFDLRLLACDYEGFPIGSVPRDVLRRDARRILKRKRDTGGARLSDELVTELLSGVDSVTLRRTAEELIIARHLASATLLAEPSLRRKGAGAR